MSVSKCYNNPVIKKCSRCRRMLNESEFNWKFKGKKLQYNCKACSRAYVKSHYKNNIQYYINKAKKRNILIKNESIAYIGNYLRAHKCIDCGEADILVLEFDHRISTDKYKDISKLIKGRYTIKKIITEIAKCDVRCANCHRRKTARDTNSWRLKFMRP